MGYSYMMMELWIMEGISGKKKKERKKPILKTQTLSWFSLHFDQHELWQTLFLTVISCLPVCNTKLFQEDGGGVSLSYLFFQCLT